MAADRPIENALRVGTGNSRTPSATVLVGDCTWIATSVIDLSSVRGRSLPTERPTELPAVLIRTSCPPGGPVDDGFTGSGAVGEACLLKGRRYLGCEIDPVMVERARLRLQGFAVFYPEDGDG